MKEKSIDNEGNKKQMKENNKTRRRKSNMIASLAVTLPSKILMIEKNAGKEWKCN